MNRKGQVFPIERRALLKHAGLAAAGFAVMPLAACEAPNKLLQGSTGGSNPLAIPPLQVGRIEQGERVFRLSLTSGQKEFVAGVASPTIGIDAPYLGPTLEMRRGARENWVGENWPGPEKTGLGRKKTGLGPFFAQNI